MLKAFRKFIPFAKVEEQKDGTLLVYGLVTAEKPDQEDEVCDYQTTKPYYQKLVARYQKATSAVEGMETSIAPLREMHQLKAVGCGKSIDFNDDAKSIHMGFHVVEAEACKKVKAGVLIGFSQGGDYVKTWKQGKFTHYTADPGEVSLVDSPCLEDALIEQLVEKTYAYVTDNGSTELRKFKIEVKNSPAANPVTLTRAEKIVRVRKAHSLVCGTIQKGMYEVSQVASVLQTLKNECGWLYAEKDFEGDDSPVPDKLKGVLSQLVEVFQELVAEETSELLGSLEPAKGEKAMKPELVKIFEKLAKAGSQAVTLTKEELNELVEFAKAGKTIGEHLNNLHKMHTDHHMAMCKAHTDFKEDAHAVIAKCHKVLGTSESGSGAVSGGGEKTYTPEELQKFVDDAIAKAKAAAEAPKPLTQADVDAAVAAALEKMKAGTAAANDPANKAKLILVGRDGKTIEKAQEITVKPGEELAKSAGF